MRRQITRFAFNNLFDLFFYKWSNKYHDTHFLHQIFMRQHELFGGLKAKKKCIFLPSCQHFMSMACIRVKNTFRCGQWCCRCDGPKMGTEWRTHLKIKEVFCYRIWENKTNIYIEIKLNRIQMDKGKLIKAHFIYYHWWWWWC